jgi:hypothetical protein
MARQRIVKLNLGSAPTKPTRRSGILGGTVIGDFTGDDNQRYVVVECITRAVKPTKSRKKSNQLDLPMTGVASA